MSPILSNKWGITLIEGLISILITSVGLLALLSMQSPAWQLSGKSDYMGRAAGILNKELSRQELWIMNPCNTVTTGTTVANVNASGQGTAQTGDATFTVTTVISAPASNWWRITVTVTWPNSTFTLSDSVDVTRQEPFRYGGC